VGHQGEKIDFLLRKLKNLSENASMFYTAIFFFFLAAVQVGVIGIDWWSSGFGNLNRIAEMIRVMVLCVVGTNFFCLDIGLGIFPYIPKVEDRDG
jgi:hypothetical protein